MDERTYILRVKADGDGPEVRERLSALLRELPRYFLRCLSIEPEEQAVPEEEPDLVLCE